MPVFSNILFANRRNACVSKNDNFIENYVVSYSRSKFSSMFVNLLSILEKVFKLVKFSYTIEISKLFTNFKTWLVHNKMFMLVDNGRSYK